MNFNLKMNWVTHSSPLKLIISLALLNYKNDLIHSSHHIQDDKIRRGTRRVVLEEDLYLWEIRRIDTVL